MWNEHIRPNLIPALLKLHFICDVVDLQTGFVAVQPFLKETQPPLAGCSIRLCRKVDINLQRLAERAVRNVTHGVSDRTQDDMFEKTSSSTFRILDLPSELQHHILSFTDLVTPFGEVEWNPSTGMYYRYRFGDGLREPTYRACWEFSYPSGCYCRSYHSAFSNIHRCQCWAPSTPIFLVSKAIREVALQVFFGLNRFIVTSGVTWNCACEPPERLPISIFLKGVIPADGYQFLRFLEVVFPPFGQEGPVDYCAPTSAAWRDWVRTLDYVKDKLDLPKLTVRVYFASWLPADGPEDIPPYRAYIDKNDAYVRAVKKSYLDVILPLKRFRGLKGFFAHLPCPTEYAEGPHQGRVLKLVSLEREAERVVMGYEYDAFSAGKSDIVESVWSEIHWARGNFGN